MELDRATFKRLVWLHLATGVAWIAAGVISLLFEQWIMFQEDFDALVSRHFGSQDPSDAAMAALLVGAGGLIIWMVVSSVGLLFFRPWSRFGFWASGAVLLVMQMVIFGIRPAFATPVDDILALIDGGLFGAILLLAYAKGHGAEWFARSSLRIEE